jgi:hypothetical protein
MMKHGPLLVLVTAIAACGSDDPASPTPSSSSSSSSGSASSSSGSTSSSSGTTTIPTTPTTVDGIPARDPAAFHAWLQTKEYAAWPKESAAHASTGPHAASVLTHLAPKLDASLKAGNAEHPKGSAAVKEFLSNGQVTGWAAYVKTEDTSEGGQGWYWYEVFSVEPGGSTIEGQGKTTCTGCHSGGKDFVMSPYPLQ